MENIFFAWDRFLPKCTRAKRGWGVSNKKYVNALAKIEALRSMAKNIAMNMNKLSNIKKRQSIQSMLGVRSSFTVRAAVHGPLPARGSLNIDLLIHCSWFYRTLR